ncbi:LANO_0D11056g1_1 [Lachancea nothofagi CBS 11611]|uniref:LANO_0D11056g1_1 n=1 Tax=Lachancea nothofagi CBS 11611 TaxID=1266666 RepID=A0A1G4JL56_9SACH|nr:LANO_0D11056g1_1 [Lachancea nothofagi CBS 11611]
MSQSVKVVFGGYTLPSIPETDIEEVLAALKTHGVHDIDTARIYPGSEEWIGKFKLPNEFVIDTKAVGFSKGCLSKESIFKSIDESFHLLGVASVNIFYLHSPDTETPLEETVDAIDALYKQGKFKKFGVSNFTPEDVKKIHAYCVSKNYVKPTVYQGNYNAVARTIETTLFPVLRELGMSLYAYSPIAGGFLAKTPEEVKEGAGRFDQSTFIGQMYSSLYNRPSIMEALEQWGKIASKAGISNADLAYRWITHHSALKKELGDAVIIGGRSKKTIIQTLDGIHDGPLDTESVAEIEKIWELVKDEAPLNNYTS